MTNEQLVARVKRQAAGTRRYELMLKLALAQLKVPKEALAAYHERVKNCQTETLEKIIREPEKAK